MTLKKRLLNASCAFLFLAFLVNPSLSQVYRWEDDQGQIHFTDDLGKIPPEKRPRNRDIETDQEEGKSAPTPSQKAPSSNSPTLKKKQGKDHAEGDEENTAPTPLSPKTQEYWQERIAKTRSDLEKAQADLDKLLLNQRKNLESGPGMQQRSAEFAQKRTELEEKIKTLQYDLNQGIAEEARRAGVPPGWAR